MPLSLPLVLLLLQSPGDGWRLMPSLPREVKRLYWELFETTEVTLRLVPETPDGKAPPVNLVFQAFFPGRAERDPSSGLPKWPKGPPARLAILARASPVAVIRELSLRLVIDGTTVELTGPERRYRNIPCLVATDECIPDGVEADVEPALLRTLVQARAVEARALGVPIMLTPADQMALADFVARIGLPRDDGPTK